MKQAWCLRTYLPDLLTHDGEYPEVQHILSDGRTIRRRGLEVHQQHVRKQQEEEEVHQDVAQKWGDGCKPELSPSWHYERTLWWSAWLGYACREGYQTWIRSFLHSSRLLKIFIYASFLEGAAFKEDSPLMVAVLGVIGPCASASLV